MSLPEHKNEKSRKTEGKVFNKKKWREQKYSNKAKVQRYENIRRRKAFREYNKELKREGIEFKNGNANNKLSNFKSKNTFRQALQKQQEILKEKEEKRKERERIEKERNEAIKAYKEKKAMRFRKLSQKTKKGQPLMKGRIELLLEKIQKEYAINNTNS